MPRVHRIDQLAAQQMQRCAPVQLHVVEGIGQYLGQLRLHANLLFSYMNTFIDLISDMELNYAENRKRLFMEALNETDSPNKSESIAREKTRVLEAKIGMMKANLNQIRNSYENYNSICMYLMSRNKEFISERIMG